LAACGELAFALQDGFRQKMRCLRISTGDLIDGDDNTEFVPGDKDPHAATGFEGL